MPDRPVTRIVADTVTGTVDGAWQAVQMPFEDLNLKRQDIPEKLQKVVANPYDLPPHLLCEGIRKEIGELDALLGPDICTPYNPTGAPAKALPWKPVTTTICTPRDPTGVSRKGEYVEKGVGYAKEHAVGMVSSKANIIPFRGVVRKVTGAEKHAKEVDRAYQAGKLRRAFLKGVAASLGPECLNPPMTTLPPGAPLPATY